MMHLPWDSAMSADLLTHKSLLPAARDLCWVARLLPIRWQHRFCCIDV